VGHPRSFFLDERCVQDCYTTFFGQLDDLYSWQRFLLIQDVSDVLGICQTCMASNRGMLT
jgi:hypothetical protein